MESSPFRTEGSYKVKIDGAILQSWLVRGAVVIDLLLELHISVHVLSHCPIGVPGSFKIP